MFMPGQVPSGWQSMAPIATDGCGASTNATGRAVANLKQFHGDLVAKIHSFSLSCGAFILVATCQAIQASHVQPPALD
jgi:hypothetical protein